MNEQYCSNITRRNFIKTAAAVTAGFAVTGSISRLSAQTEQPPNILYLMTDQQRADCIGCANPAISTPNLDSIAGQGVRFTTAYTSAPSCTPARSALLTGLSPWHHGMLGYGRVARKYPFELPQAMRDAGYYTFGIGKMHWYPERNLHGLHGALLDEARRQETPGFVSDYHRWFKEKAPDLDPYVTALVSNDYRAKVYALPEKLHPTYWTGRMAVDFLEKYDKPQPFLLKVSFHRPHSPYDPPQRFMQMYAEDDMPKAHIGKWAEKFAPRETPPRFDLWHGDLGEAQVKHSRRGYYGEVTFVDEQIGRILTMLKKRGFYENTLIIFFTDHGDMLGDHHLWRKTYAYEASAKIPMLLRWPQSFGCHHMRGKTLTQPVELRDVLPTFLDAAGANIPEHLDGMSLLKLIRQDSKNWRPFIDLEHDASYGQKNHWNALTDGRFKYIYHAYDGHEQLFDLKNDPGEIYDLAADPAYSKTLKTWRNRLTNHLAERGEAFVSNGRLVQRPKRLLYSPLFPAFHHQNYTPNPAHRQSPSPSLYPRNS